MSNYTDIGAAISAGTLHPGATLAITSGVSGESQCVVDTIDWSAEEIRLTFTDDSSVADLTVRADSTARLVHQARFQSMRIPGGGTHGGRF